MSNQYQYSEQHLTPSIAQELIQELFAGETVQVQQIKNKVDEVHKERGGLPPRGRVNHPVTYALSRMKQLGLAENPRRGQWFILPTEHSQAGSSGGESKIETLEQFIKWASKFERGKYIFRGVPNAEYGIQASAYRRPKENRSFEKFLQVNRDLIREAQLRGFDQKDGRELKELEILADLQHFRAATCLIDFTHSSHIALWFACQPSSNESKECKKSKKCKKLRESEKSEECKKPPNGKVFAVRYQHPSRFKEITPKFLKEDIDFFLKDGDESQLYHWQPRQQNHRIVAQQSIFLFGRFEFEPDGECIIAEDSKENILSELQKVSGITEDRLFPDFEGFARLRGEEFPYTELTASGYQDRGFEAYERGDTEDYKNAIADYDKAIDLQPDDAVTHYLRGLANYRLERYNDALSDYDAAINLQSDYADAYYDRGLANYRLERYNDALSDYDAAINLDPNDAVVYIDRGLTKYQLEWYEEALEDFDEAIRLQSNRADAYHYRGAVKFRLGQVSNALEDFDEAIRLDPNNLNTYLNRGIIKNRLSEYSSAILDFDAVIRLDPKNAEAYYNRAQSKFRLQLLDAAKEDLLTVRPLAADTGDEDLIDLIDNMLSEVNFRISRGTQDE